MADRGVSRRDLFGGILRRPVEELKDKLPKALGGVVPGARPAPTPAAARPAFPRRIRPPMHTIVAVADAAGRFRVDLNAKPLDVGRSWRVAAAELAEPLVLVHVSPTHYAAATGECAVDGSDVQWHPGEDVLWCPACGSRWRLDGAVVRGPARRGLLSLHVDEAEGVVRIDVP